MSSGPTALPPPPLMPHGSTATAATANPPKAAATPPRPSSATLPERLQSISVSGLAVQSTEDGDDLVVRAPRGYDPRCGDELYNWYGNAGYGKTGSVEEWREAEDKFYYQYGFRMW